MKTNDDKSPSASMRRFIFAVNQKEAREIIAEFRDFWGIDPEGFKNQKKYYEWVRKTINNPSTTFKRESLKAEKTSYLITKVGIKEFRTKRIPQKTKIKNTNKQPFSENFQRAVDELGFKIKMDNNWSRLFSSYLLWGPKKLSLDSEPGISIDKITEYYEKGKPIKQHLEITVDPNTTKNELVSAWERFISSVKENLVGVINPPSHKKFNKPNW